MTRPLRNPWRPKVPDGAIDHAPGRAPGRVHERDRTVRVQRLSALVAASSLVLLCACASTTPTRHHILEAVPPAAVGTSATGAGKTYRGPPVQVGSVRVPPAMDREELVRETAPGELQILEFDHWAAPLQRLSRQALAEDLAARLPYGRIVFPGASWPLSGATLSIDVGSFKVVNGVATMALTWSLHTLTQGSATPVSRRGGQLELETPAGDGAAATARAWSVLLGQLADRLTGELSAS